MVLKEESTIAVKVRVDSITTSIDRYSILLRIKGFAIDYSMNIFPVVLDESYEIDEIEKCHKASKKYRVGSNHYVTGTFSLYTSPARVYIYPSSVSLLEDLEKINPLKEYEEYRFADDTWSWPMHLSGKIIRASYHQPDSAARMMFVELAAKDKIAELVLFSREIRRYEKLIKIDNLIDVYGRTAGGEAPSSKDLLKEKVIVDRVGKCRQLDI